MRAFSRLFFGFFLFVGLSAWGQTENILPLRPLSKADMEALKAIPELRMDASAMKRSLPSSVDNSALPYMPTLVSQVGLECGQASSIGIMFSYEINSKRGVSGSFPENRYATHFTYNFLNGGSDAGINYFESMEIVKEAGNPNVADYGGMATGGASRWMTGYDKYYNAMQNRVGGIYAIRTNTVEGINTLRQWIYDHGDGSAAGGMASFYSQFTSPPSVLPAGTPEAGKSVIPSWGSSPNHAMAIVGYNDNICWDYNNDGQYTNNIDINGDGIVDVRDWEIGGFKMVNTYGSVSYWGDNGYSYMMYKSLADATDEGGIWNNQIIVVDAKEQYRPKLTAKATLTYPSRNKLKLMVGVATDPQATEPEFVHQYPMFDFQGGDKPMQGSAGGSTIEIGLDMNSLLQYVEPGQEAAFFFMVVENDPGNSSQGTINSFSLMDYTSSNVVEIPSGILLLPIQNNTVTMVKVVAALNFNKVNVATADIQPFVLYEQSAVQLQAQGGSTPYDWHLLYRYDTLQNTALFPLLNGSPVQVSGSQDGVGEVELPFEFPFYGEKFHKIYVAVDGFIMFEPSLVTWPYYIAGKTYLIRNKIIAPALSKPFYVGSGDGIWAEVKDDRVTVRWKLSVYGQGSGSEVSMAATLHHNGTIEFFYGTHIVPDYVARFAGISNGDGENMIILNKTGTFIPANGQHHLFSPLTINDQVQLTKNGVLNAYIDEYMPGQTVEVMVNDRDNMRAVAAIPVEVRGVVLDYVVNAGGDNIIEHGEAVRFDMHIENKTAQNLSPATLSLSIDDAAFVVQESSVTLPALAQNDALNLTDIFDFQAVGQLPNGYQTDATLMVTAPEGSWTRPIKLTVFSPELKLLTLSVNDGQNGILEPGETANLVVRLKNTGGAKLSQIVALLTTPNPDLNILTNTAAFGWLPAGEVWEAVFPVTLSGLSPPMQAIELQLSVTADNGFAFAKTLTLMTSLIVENFESGGFSLFDWTMAGNAPWTITTQSPYEGSYAARSGTIGHSQYSTMSMAYEVAFDDTLSFYYKVSSENNYDFLRFYINGVQKGSVSGDKPWTFASYPVQAGPNTFSWTYEKDYSVSNGSDCGWVDYILLPAIKIYTGVEESRIAESYLIKISPNPVTDRMRVEVTPSADGPFVLALLDGKGRQLNASSYYGNKGSVICVSPETEDLSAGLYYVVLQSGSHSIVKPVVLTGR